MAFVEVPPGETCGRQMSQRQCKRAAAGSSDLKWSDDTSAGADKPSGCFYDVETKTVRFNSNASTPTLSSETVVQLCRKPIEGLQYEQVEGNNCGDRLSDTQCRSIADETKGLAWEGTVNLEDYPTGCFWNATKIGGGANDGIRWVYYNEYKGDDAALSDCGDEGPCQMCAPAPSPPPYVPLNTCGPRYLPCNGCECACSVTDDVFCHNAQVTALYAFAVFVVFHICTPFIMMCAGSRKLPSRPPDEVVLNQMVDVRNVETRDFVPEPLPGYMGRIMKKDIVNLQRDNRNLQAELATAEFDRKTEIEAARKDRQELSRLRNSALKNASKDRRF